MRNQKKPKRPIRKNSESLSGILFGWGLNFLFLCVASAIIFFAARSAYYFGMDLFVENKSDVVSEEVRVSIPAGSSVVETGRILQSAGLVKSDLLFLVQATLNGMGSGFNSGDFILDKTMTSIDIMYALSAPVASNELRLTVIEGLTTRQIADLVESRELFTAAEFIAATREEFDYESLPNVTDAEFPLEGYLFPDTYFLPDDPTPRDLIVRMLNRFGDIFNPQHASAAAELGLSVDDVIKMASIIEKEVRVANERRLVSAVIHNRLEQDMPLQMCSTVLYVLGIRRDRLTVADTQVASPFNTYTNHGLPIRPISNPGESAILAALNPADVDYLFFVIKDNDTGEHAFTSDYDEFLQYKSLYNQLF